MQDIKVKEFLEKIKKLEKSSKLDLSSDEDLSVAVMNLISLEEHMFFSFGKTKKGEFLKYLQEVREMRKSLMKRLIKRKEGEVWCISKHLLAASMRLLEVGTKYLNKGEEKQAQELFEKAYNLYSLFWGINLGFVKIPGEGKKGNEEDIVFVDERQGKSEKMSIFEKLGEIVKKAIDCCRE